jgi:hypothetical protein
VAQARLEDTSSSEDGPQICITVESPERRTYLLRSPDQQTHTSWLAVLQRVTDSMKQKAMPEAIVEVSEDGVRVYDSASSTLTAFYKITKLRNWKATQTHLHLCADVHKQPENHLFRTTNAGTLAKALNKAAKLAAKSGLSSSAVFSKSASHSDLHMPKSPRSPREYYADEGDSDTRDAPPPRLKQPKIQKAATLPLHIDFNDESEPDAPRAPPPAAFHNSAPIPTSQQTQHQSQLRMPQGQLAMSSPNLHLSAPPPLVAPVDGMLVRALYDYAPKDETRLAMSRGDVLRVVKEIDEHWFRCQLGERKGIVPRSYVRAQADEIVATAIADFDDNDEKHLRFDKSEKIVILTRVESSDWWDGVITVGEPPTQYTRVGIFPIVLVEVTKGKPLFDDLASAP